MSTAAISFVIPGTPRGKQVARVTRFGNYTPKQTADELEAVRYIASAAMHGRPPLDGPVELRICAYRAIPTSFSKRQRERALAGQVLPISRPDGSNYQKLLEDGCNQIVWRDDSQVVRWQGWKLYSDTPRLSVEVIPIVLPPGE
jgi:Holliday junction resolvase RusA-like endonuclease